ncbi:MAG TPA: LysR family transcriptional regulator [Woeseiaceae bacterium]|nr:LysR family transcriptional regulator [Woeseiaceae bacterium]
MPESPVSITGDMVLFAKVADSGSISGASRMTGLERTTISRRLSRLEKRLGANLLDRSKREIGLTDAGQLYYLYCQQVVEAAADGETRVREFGDPRARFARVSVALPGADTFLASYLNISVSPRLSECIRYQICPEADRFSEKNTDLLLQLGTSSPVDFIVTRLRSIPQAVWCSTDFASGKESLGSLSSLDCISPTEQCGTVQWRFTQDKRSETLEIQPRFLVNNIEACRDACLGGNGIALLPIYLCEAFEAAGRLKRLAIEWQAPSAILSAVTRRGQIIDSQLMSLIAHLKHRC